MKTTVKLNTCSSITIQPTKAGTLLVEIQTGGEDMAVFCMTPDQWGALMIGGEMAFASMPAGTVNYGLEAVAVTVTP